MHRKIKCIDAGTFRIVAYLGLYLVVVLTGYCDIALSLDGMLNIGQARALTENGIGQVRAFLTHDLCSRHQEALNQMPLRDAGFFNQVVVFNILRKHGRQSGNLGRSHGSAAHRHILIRHSGFTVQRER